MAEYFVGPVMEKLIDACFEYLKDQVRWKTDVEEELKKLQNILPQIQAMVFAYSQVEIKDSALNKWYWQLRDAIDEADDVLDEIEYRKLQKQASKNNRTGKVRSLMKSIKKRVMIISKRALEIDSCLKRLEAAVQKLNEVSSRVSTFRDLLKDENQKQEQQQLELHETRETGSTPANVLLGRSKEMEFIRQWLSNSYETQNTDTDQDFYKNISLLSVVGLGGMGKTTLLQHVYKDATLNKDGATEGFDVKMWACVSNKFDARKMIKNILESLIKERPDLDTIEALQSRLESEVTSKRFLLVLDDIWEEGEGKWENVLAPLQYGNSGSKILITTRMDSVASNIPMIENKKKLQLKGLEENECVWLFKRHAFGIGMSSNIDQNLLFMARDIVKKLSGCPLVIKIIGSSLKSKHDVRYWRKVNIDIENGGLKGLLPILKLSYTYLSDFLQLCFAFCSIFPEDHEFDKDDLVRMWISLGFIQPSHNSGETIEETGSMYFDMLVEKSFFDKFCEDSDDEVYYKMHDLLNELARSVSAQECFRIEDDRAFTIPKITRHLSINGISCLEAAFMRMGEFKNLHSLFISFSFSGKFDENILSEILKASKSIRLLVINYFWLENIPETIGCLIHLRYLRVGKSWTLKLPRSISHLYHLQFIILDKLPDLEMYNIGWKELMPNENCQLILEELLIKDFSATQLIMESLRRISFFRFLRIENNDKLNSFPTETEQWFLQHSSSLRGILFSNLQSLQSLPSSLQSLSSLNTLKVFGVPQLKLLTNLPASLVTLELCDLKSLQFLPSSFLTNSSLNHLRLVSIPLLKSLPDLSSSSLTNLELNRIPLLQSLPDLPSSSLTNLELKYIPLLKSLPDLPSSLTTIELEQLTSLQCSPFSFLAISSLHYLRLNRIPLLESLPDLPPSLRQLYLINLENLDCLPSCLPTLQALEIRYVPRLLELPDLPTSLQSMWISDVPGLLELPDLPASLQNLRIDHCHPHLMERYPNIYRWR